VFVQEGRHVFVQEGRHVFVQEGRHVFVQEGRHAGLPLLFYKARATAAASSSVPIGLSSQPAKPWVCSDCRRSASMG
jgi:hypothetical protein